MRLRNKNYEKKSVTGIEKKILGRKDIKKDSYGCLVKYCSRILLKQVNTYITSLEFVEQERIVFLF